MLVLTPARVSHAAPAVDQNAGTWTDRLVDNAGLATNLVQYFGVVYRPTTRLVALADDAPRSCRQATCAANEGPGRYGQVATTAIAPVSFSTWGEAFVKFTASQEADVEVRFLGSNGTTYGPLPLLGSQDPAWTRKVDLSTLPHSLTSGRLLVHLRERVIVNGVDDRDANRPNGDPADVRIAPTFEGARVTWVPRALVNVAVSASETACSNAPFNVRVRVAVSLVSAEGLVVYVPLATPAADQFGRTYPLTFSKATDDGRYTELGVQLGDVIVPPRSVYWQFGTRAAGNTWVVSYDVLSPVGTLNGTTYLATAHARAENALDATSPVPAPTSIISAPAPTISLEAATADQCLVGGEIPGDEGRLSYTLTVANHKTPPAVCAEAYHRTVVYQELDDLVLPHEGTSFGSVFSGTPPSAFTISDGGDYTGSGFSIYGVTIPPRSVYWLLGTLEVGASRTLTVGMDLEATTRYGGPIPVGHVAESSASIHSGFRPQSATANEDVTFGYTGGFGGISYMMSEHIRSASGATRGVDDSPSLSIGYGERYEIRLQVGNESASTIVDTVMLVKIPTGTTLAAVPPSNGQYTFRYNTGGAGNADDDPPDFTRITQTFGGSWSATPPSDLRTIRWVAVVAPFIYSDLPDGCTGTSAGGGSHINVPLAFTVDLPVDGCAEGAIFTRGLIQSRGLLIPGETEVTPVPDTGSWAFSDLERVNLKPVLPGLAGMNVGATPSQRVGPGEVTFTVNVPNVATGAAQTDTARDVVVTLTMPRMSINGALAPLPFVSVIADRGTIDYAQLPARLVVRYPTIAPNDSRVITLKVNVPSGYVSGQALALAVEAAAQDDVCGAVRGTATRSVVATGNPYLVVTKEVNLRVAAHGREITYELGYTNRGETVSTGTWIVDQVPAALALTWATASPNGGEVWFSNQGAPILPATLRSASPVWSEALVRASFVKGVEANGRVQPPAGFGRVTWIAFRVDDTTLMPALLQTGSLRSVTWAGIVGGEAVIGEVIRNEAAIFSSELLAAISNEAGTLLSVQPSLDVARTCPDVTAAGDDVTYHLSWVNNATNDDYQVRLIETLPAGVTFVSATHVWNPAAARFDDVDVHPTWNAASRTLTWDVSAAIDPTGATPIKSLEGGELEIKVRVAPNTPTGTFAELSGVAMATDVTDALPLTLVTGCAILVENPDLFVRIGIDQPAPISGETVTYTVIASNEGANVADETALVVTLPLGVSFAEGPGDVFLYTAGWAFAGSSAPAVSLDAEGREVLTWSVATGNALVRTGSPAGELPARSESVNLGFRALVRADVPPATTLVATVDIATTSEEDDVYPNSDSVTAVTPLPDPRVDKSGPGFAQPGASVSYRLQYRNESRQAASAVFVVDRLWDAAPADGQADVTLLGVSAGNGELVYYNDAPLTGLEPGFDPDYPELTGWRTDIGAAPVNWIGFYRVGLAGNAGPYDVHVDVALRHPVTGQEPQAGATILNVATIRIPVPDELDEDRTNNTDTVRTQTPGVDVGAELVCDPVGAWPGATPGQEARATLVLRNQGTTRAYGLRLDWAPESWFELVADTAAAVEVRDADGRPASAVDANGAPITGGLRWNRVGDSYVLGEVSEQSPRYYRKVGLPANTYVELAVIGRVGDVASGTIVAHDLVVATDYRFDFDADNDEVEEITDNNAANCRTTVYRADPMVLKTAGGATASGSYTAGDRVEYDIQYDNTGGASAEGVFIEDYLPTGTSFVVGSMSNVPDGTTVAYDDGSGAFSYAPSGAVGDVDRNIRAFRIAWDQALSAPAGATFQQETRFDFEDGSFASTRVSDDGESVIVAGAGGASGRYTTPPIPTDPSATVVAWGRIVVEGLLEDPAAALTVAVLDAGSDEVIADGLVPDVSGAIALDIDAQLHPRIKLRVDLVGRPVVCSPEEPCVQPIAMGAQRRPDTTIYPGGCSTLGDVVGTYKPTEQIEAGIVWTRAANGTYSATPLSGGLPRHFYDEDTIVGERTGGLAVWKRTTGGWTLVPTPDWDVQSGESQLTWSFGGAWDASHGVYVTTYTGPNSNALVHGAYLPDGSGGWRYQRLNRPPADSCRTPVGVDGTVIMKCKVDNAYRPALWRPALGDESTLEMLPLPAGAPGQSNDGFDALFQAIHGAELFAFWIAGSTYIYEKRDGSWQTFQIGTYDGPGYHWNTRVTAFGSAVEAGGYMRDPSNTNIQRAAIYTRTSTGWTVSTASLPAGLVGWAQSGTNTANNGEAIVYREGYGWIISYRPWGQGDRSYQLYRDSGGAWAARALALPTGATSARVDGMSQGGWLVGTASFIETGITRSYRALWEPLPLTGLVRDFRALAERVPRESISAGFLSLYRWSSTPTAVAARWSSCGVDLTLTQFDSTSAHANGVVDRTTLAADGFTVTPLPMPLETFRDSPGRISGSVNGAFIGYNTNQGANQAVVFVPGDDGRLEAYNLVKPADTTSNSFSAYWISPDHQVVVGQYQRTVAGFSSDAHTMWQYDAATDRYLHRQLAGAGNTRSGTATNFGTLDFSSKPRSVAAVAGRSVSSTNNWQGFPISVNGVWFYTGRFDTPLVWLHSILPGASGPVNLFDGGSDFAAVTYTDTLGAERFAVIEQDPGSTSGWRFATLERPAGWESAPIALTSPYSGRAGGLVGVIGNRYAWPPTPWSRAIWLRTGQTWVAHPLPGVDPDTAYSYAAASRRRFGPEQLPLVWGPAFANQLAQPLPEGGYGAPRWDLPQGTTSFSPWYLNSPFDWLPHHQGLAVGWFDGSTRGYQFFRDDLTWQGGLLPMPESCESVSYTFVAPGPVIYGACNSDSTLKYAWYFEGGDMSKPRLVNLTPLLGQDAYGNWRNCTWNIDTFNGGGGFTSENDAGYARSVLNCGGGEKAIVTPSASGISVTVTEVPYYGGLAYAMIDSEALTIWNSSRAYELVVPEGGGEGVALTATKVLYRTDKSPSFQYRVEVDDLCQVAIANTARVYTASAQITEDNDESTVTSDIATADLGVDVTSDRGTVLPGQNLTFTATVTNRGPGLARDVEVTLDWPAGSGVGGTREIQTLASLRPGEVRTFTNTIAVTADAANLALDAAAAVTTGSIDCDASDDFALTRALTGELPNVAVTLTGPATWRIGDSARYVATAFNDGTTVANDVTLEVTVPPYGTLQDVLVEGDGLDIDCTQTAQRVTCAIASLAPIASGGVPAVVTLVMVNPSCEDAAGAFDMVATVDAELDANASDNLATASTTILGAPGALVIQAEPSRSTVTTGDALTWYIHYRNDGTEAVSGATLEATLPVGVTLRPGDTTAGFSQQGATLSWPLPTIDPRRGGTVAVSVTVTAAAPATLSGGAAIALPDGSNACEVDTVLGGVAVTGPGLHIMKRASAAVACAEPIDWRITVTNDGATDLVDLVIADQVPSASPYVSGSIEGVGGSVVGPGSLRWSIPRLAAGTSITVGFRSQAPASSGLLVSNVATVTHGGQTLASAPASVWATCDGAALRLAKSWTESCALTGEPLEVTVRAVNAGARSVAAPGISDPLPLGLTYVTSSTGASYDPGTRRVTQSASSLLPGQTLTMRYSATVTGAEGELVLGAATLTTTGEAPQVSNTAGGVILDCDDGLACTADTCDEVLGCVHTAIGEETICDGLDEDCDGVVDDGLTRTVTCGVGACARSSTVETCIAGEWSGPACDPLAGATTEVCNLIDDDCDGAVDEDLTTTTRACVMDGGCAGMRTFGCVAGTMQALDTCSLVTAIVDICNGLDDDCDSRTDEDADTTTGTCTLPGGCPGTTTLACVAGRMTAVGECTLSGTVVDDCDGVDQDCDGETDEDFVPEPVVCNEDTCAVGQGLTTCECGEPGTTCDPAWAIIPDTSCTAQASSVAYAIVYDDDTGAARGTIRCTQDAQGVVRCDEDPDAPGDFKVYDELWCPGVSPPREPRECKPPVYGWSKAFGPDTSWISTASVVTDPSGNIYLTGNTSSPIDFGGGPLTSSRTPATNDAFYVKLAPDGTHLWSHRVQAQTEGASSAGAGIFADAAGHVYLAGRLDPGTSISIGGVIVGPYSGTGAFLAKLDASGAPVWVKTFDGYGDSTQPIVVDASGDITVVSGFSGTINLGAGDLSVPSWGALVARFRSDGTLAWAKALGPQYIQGLRLALGGAGEVVLGGTFYGTLTLGTESFDAPSGAGFITPLDQNGNHPWTRVLQGTSLTGLSVSPSGDIAVTGGFASGTDWGGDPLSLPSGSGVVLARYAPSGAHVSSQIVATTESGWVGVNGVAIGADGLVAVTGGFYQSAMVGGVPLSSEWDTFVALLGPDGSARWVEAGNVTPRSGNTWSPQASGQSVARSPSGAVIGSGWFAGEIDLGFGPIAHPGNGMHLYLVSLPPEGPQ